jgi:hypothetical protein
MIEFFLGLLTGLLAFYIWNRLAIYMTLLYLERNDIDISKILSNSQVDKDENIEVIQARLEEHHGQFFVYRIDNNEFIAQGKSAKEIGDRVEQRVRDKPVFIVQADDAVLGRYRATKEN